MKREKVHTVDVFWDGPIAGAANLEEKPHYFDVVEDDIEFPDGSLSFTLTSISEEVFQLIIENAQIRLRWQKAIDNEEASMDSEPALPEDREKHDNNRFMIDTYLYRNEHLAFVKRGVFHQLENGQYEVVWFKD